MQRPPAAGRPQLKRMVLGGSGSGGTQRPEGAISIPMETLWGRVIEGKTAGSQKIAAATAQAATHAAGVTCLSPQQSMASSAACICAAAGCDIFNATFSATPVAANPWTMPLKANSIAVSAETT
ncbi:MAG TPA: hypothetical protein VNK48_02745 [Xanthobacteraceae bacterium]|nr:hypothetical protein [Xanthobacteraceae bacterium]